MITLIILLIAAVPICVVVLLVQNIRLGRKIADLGLRVQITETQLEQTRQDLSRLRTAPRPPPAETQTPTPSAEAMPLAPEEPTPAPESITQRTAPEQPITELSGTELSGTERSATPNAPDQDGKTSSLATPPDTPPAFARPSGTPPQQAGKKPSKTTSPSQGERALAERWMVWLGGLTLALGGAFLVKYSADQGLITAEIRILLASLGGLFAMGLGHWLWRRDLGQNGDRPATAAETPEKKSLFAAAWNVPTALVGAGSAILFASLYSGYALYDLLPASVAFGALALTALLTLLMALKHGPFVALLGILGGYAVPMLVSTGTPALGALLGYLLVISAAALAILRWKEWYWLGWVIKGGNILWVTTALLFIFEQGDEVFIGSYLAALLGLFAALRLGVPKVPALAGRCDRLGVTALVYTGSILLTLLSFFTLYAAEWSAAAWVTSGLLSTGFILLGWRDKALDLLPWLSAPLVILGMLGWDLGDFDPDQLDTLLTFALPEHASLFGWVAAAFALLHLAGGLLVAEKSARPWRWVALACTMPLMILAAAYSRMSSLLVDLGWSFAAVLLAALMLGLASRLVRLSPALSPTDQGSQGSQGKIATKDTAHPVDLQLAAYASGVLAALSLAATFALRDAWLTVALAMMPLGLGWIIGKLPVPGLRKIAAVFVGLVLVRLVFNPYTLDYDAGGASAVPWLAYGYGLPALAFALASVYFRRHREGHLVSALEGTSALFGVVMAIRWVHSAFADFAAQSEMDYPLAEQGGHSMALAGAGVLFLLLHRRNRRLVPLVAGTISTALAGLHTLGISGIFGNPGLTGEPIGPGWVLNDLLIAFAGPALLIGVAAWLTKPIPYRDKALTLQRPTFAVLAGMAGALWATLQIRQHFSPDILNLRTIGESELWAYSALYLLIGVGVLLAGLKARTVALRHTGLAITLGVVAKVFLVDLSQTEGLWRALSFLALGACLLGLGFLYRTFLRIDDSGGGKEDS